MSMNDDYIEIGFTAKRDQVTGEYYDPEPIVDRRTDHLSQQWDGLLIQFASLVAAKMKAQQAEASAG